MRIDREYLLENHADLVEAFRVEGREEERSVLVADESRIAPELLQEIEGRTADTEALRAEGATAERERIQGIQELTIAGHEDLAAAAIEEGVTPEVFAVRQVKAEQQAGSGALSRMRAAEKELDAPEPAAPKDDAVPEEKSADAEGERLFALSPRGRRKQAASG